jgi:hypothetical protein
MWYREAYKQFNIYGLPVAEFADEQTEVDEDLEVEPNNAPEITIDDPTPEDEFTPEDLQQNIQTLEQDPTANLKLPPLHNLEDPGCYCKIENRPLLSYPGVQDALRVWVVNHFNNDTGRPINNCPKCTESAKAFNVAEKIRLQNKGININ